jgi:2-phosphoglycerate kinase
MGAQRSWHVVLIGGASGVGKSQLSYPLAQHFGVGITEVDDFQVILERMTTPEQYPVLHLFRTDPEAFFALDKAGKLDVAIAYATVMAEALETVIANHLDGGAPIVLEGISCCRRWRCRRHLTAFPPRVGCAGSSCTTTRRRLRATT